MPLKLSFGLKKKKGKVPDGGEGGNSEGASAMSTPPLTKSVQPSASSLLVAQWKHSIIDAPQVPFGYLDRDIKKLPKLHRAVLKDKSDRVQEITLSRKYEAALVDKAGRTALHMACARGDQYLVQLLLDGRGSMRAMIVADMDGYTPLHVALLYMHESCASRLLTAGAKVTDKTKDDKTPLHLAAATGSLTICQNLISKHVEIDCSDMDGHTPLALAVVHNKLTIVEFLVSKQSNVNFLNLRNQTPLMLAAMGGYSQVAIALLSVPTIDVAIRDHSNYTALDYAKQYPSEIVHYIANFAKRNSSASQRQPYRPGMPMFSAFEDESTTESGSAEKSQRDDADRWMTDTSDEDKSPQGNNLRRASDVFRQNLTQGGKKDEALTKASPKSSPVVSRLFSFIRRNKPSPPAVPKHAGSSVTTTSKAEEQPPSPVATTPSTPRRPPPSIPVDKKPPKKEEPAAQTIATKQPSSDPEPAVEERPEPTHNTPVMPTSSKELLSISSCLSSLSSSEDENEPLPGATATLATLPRLGIPLTLDFDGLDSDFSEDEDDEEEDDLPLPGDNTSPVTNPPQSRPAMPMEADFDDPESATSSEEDEPLPGVAAALTASTPPLPRPAVPLGADFDDSDSYLSEEENEEEPSLPGAALATSTPTPPQPAVPLGADFDDTVSYVSEEEKDQTLSRRVTFAPTPLLAVPFGGDTDESDSYVSSEEEKVDEPLPEAAEKLSAPAQPTVPLGADFDDSDSYVSSEGEKVDEEDEPLPGAAAALTALTHPTVPLGADFDDSDSYVSEEEKEDKDEPLPGAATALSAPAQPLGADFDDSDSYVSEEEKDDEVDEPLLPGAAAALSTPAQPTVPLGADFDDSDSFVSEEEEEDLPVPVTATTPPLSRPALHLDDPKSSSDEDEPLPGVAAVLTSTPTLPRRAMALEDGFDDSESAISSEEDEPLPGASVALNGSLSRFAASLDDDRDETEESPSSEDEPLPGAAAALSALSDLTLPLSALDDSDNFSLSDDEEKESPRQAVVPAPTTQAIPTKNGDKLKTVTPTVAAIKEEEEVQLTKPASPLVGDSSADSSSNDASSKEEVKKEGVAAISPKSLPTIVSAIHTASPVEKMSQTSLQPSSSLLNKRPSSSIIFPSMLNSSLNGSRRSPLNNRSQSAMANSRSQSSSRSPSPLTISKGQQTDNISGSSDVQVNTSLCSPSSQKKRRSDDSMLAHLVKQKSPDAATQRKRDSYNEFLRLMRQKSEEDGEAPNSPPTTRSISSAREALRVVRQNGVQKMAAKWERGEPSPPSDSSTSSLGSFSDMSIPARTIQSAPAAQVRSTRPKAPRTVPTEAISPLRLPTPVPTDSAPLKTPKSLPAESSPSKTPLEMSSVTPSALTDSAPLKTPKSLPAESSPSKTPLEMSSVTPSALTDSADPPKTPETLFKTSPPMNPPRKALSFLPVPISAHKGSSAPPITSETPHTPPCEVPSPLSVPLPPLKYSASPPELSKTLLRTSPPKNPLREAVTSLNLSMPTPARIHSAPPKIPECQPAENNSVSDILPHEALSPLPVPTSAPTDSAPPKTPETHLETSPPENPPREVLSSRPVPSPACADSAPSKTPESPPRETFSPLPLSIPARTLPKTPESLPAENSLVSESQTLSPLPVPTSAPTDTVTPKTPETHLETSPEALSPLPVPTSALTDTVTPKTPETHLETSPEALSPLPVLTSAPTDTVTPKPPETHLETSPPKNPPREVLSSLPVPTPARIDSAPPKTPESPPAETNPVSDIPTETLSPRPMSTSAPVDSAPPKTPKVLLEISPHENPSRETLSSLPVPTQAPTNSAPPKTVEVLLETSPPVNPSRETLSSLPVPTAAHTESVPPQQPENPSAENNPVSANPPPETLSPRPVPLTDSAPPKTPEVLHTETENLPRENPPPGVPSHQACIPIPLAPRALIGSAPPQTPETPPPRGVTSPPLLLPVTPSTLLPPNSPPDSRQRARRVRRGDMLQDARDMLLSDQEDSEYFEESDSQEDSQEDIQEEDARSSFSEDEYTEERDTTPALHQARPIVGYPSPSPIIPLRPLQSPGISKEELAEMERQDHETLAEIERQIYDLESVVTSQQDELERMRDDQEMAEESHQSTREQLKKTESRLLEAVEERQVAEMRKREIEVEYRALKKTNVKLEEELADLNNYIESCDEKLAHDSETQQDQMKQYDTLKRKASQASSENELLASLLEAATSSRRALEEKLTKALEAKSKQETEQEKQLRAGEDRARQLEEELTRLRDEGQLMGDKLTETSKTRASIQKLASEQRSELVKVKGDLSDKTKESEKLQKEVDELKELWESEIKGKHKLTEKLLEMETTIHEVDSCIDEEKQKVLKANKKKNMAEMKLEALYLTIGRLERENEELKEVLKTIENELRQAQINCPAVCLRRELKETRRSMDTEVRRLEKQLEKCKSEVKIESDIRAAAERETVRIKQEMDTLRQQISESVFALDAEERKVKWFDKRNRKLQDEMAALKEHMKSCTVTRTEMGQYKKKVDEQNQQEMAAKLKELHTLIDQQTARQQVADKQRAEREMEEKARKNKELSAVKAQLDQALDTICRSRQENAHIASKASKLKDQLEDEQRKTEKLFGQLKRAKEQARERSLEESNHARKMLEYSHTWQQRTRTAPSYMCMQQRPSTTFGQSGLVADELLTSIRSQLDSSIRRHIDTNPGGRRTPRLDSVSDYYQTD